ncbi:unnamed protein product [Prorocentrum cordatum]|uniref:FAD-binding PCMH-type domain-containing protein n=1 Tax=Prorocentrum cordatum TaxID=2364126 RepID=A0ABN9SLR1_9DINO|nr:unnamed protein product [Polarella glacialis]
MMSLLSVVMSLFTIFLVSGASQYCYPCDPCWPDQSAWDQLSSDLDGKLFQTDVTDYEVCESVPTSNLAAWTLIDAENGICMQHHSCAHDQCDSDKAWNLPAYTVRAESADDIRVALTFAQLHDIAVSVKTSGHSYSGSSTLKGSLLIWMRHFTQYGTQQAFTDSCGTLTDATLKVGGGQVWYEAYDAVKEDFNIIGGGGKTVSAAGGWLQGGGLSAMSPSYGLGIDNVLEVHAMLANGTEVVADACTNQDLFWALRGGGGGTFAIVMSVIYRLHPPSPVTQLVVYVDLAGWESDFGKITALQAWWHKIVDLQQGAGLDSRWGGYWQIAAGHGVLFFMGTNEEAYDTLITDLEAWRSNRSDGDHIYLVVTEGDSYYSVGGHEALETDIGSHAEFDIDSVLIPRSYVVDQDGAVMKSTMDALLSAGVWSFTMYQLGGQVMNVSDIATAIHPAMRAAQFSFMSSHYVSKLLRDSIPGSATCHNHHGPENRTLESLFGDNLQRLQEVKASYDPDNRFNCYHCVGWQDPGDEDFSSCAAPAETTTTASTTTATTTEETSTPDCDCSNSSEYLTVCGVDGNDYGNACLAECHGGGYAFDGSCSASLDCSKCADEDRDCVAEDTELRAGTCDEGYLAMEGCYCSSSDECEPGSFGCYEGPSAGALACGPALVSLLSVAVAQV